MLIELICTVVESASQTKVPFNLEVNLLFCRVSTVLQIASIATIRQTITLEPNVDLTANLPASDTAFGDDCSFRNLGSNVWGQEVIRVPRVDAIHYVAQYACTSWPGALV